MRTYFPYSHVMGNNQLVDLNMNSNFTEISCSFYLKTWLGQLVRLLWLERNTEFIVIITHCPYFFPSVILAHLFNGVNNTTFNVIIFTSTQFCLLVSTQISEIKIASVTFGRWQECSLRYMQQKDIEGRYHIQTARS